MPTVSFDVFDTLLTRIWAEPRDLFVALGRNLQSQGLSGLPPESYAAVREQAERSARERVVSREIGLEAIYDELSARLGWDAGQRKQAMQEELALEESGIRAVPGMAGLVEEARRRCHRVVFLSDMYLPVAFIRHLLTQAGFFQPGDEVLVSGEAGTGKGGGGLFRLAREKLQADFAAWTHHGDHPVADVKAPRSLGITAQQSIAAHPGRREMTLRGPDRFAPEWRSLLAGAARLARLDAPAELNLKQRALWNIGATVAGPLFWGFTRWCLAEAGRHGLRDLYFLARGGQIFWRIAGELKVRDASIPACHYLYSSRLAFAGAFDRSDLARLRLLAAPTLAHHTVRQTLANLGLDENTVEPPARWPRAEWDRNLPNAERFALADWLLAPERRSLVQEALHRRAQLARDYLIGMGLGVNRAGVVDTGWMGTIQKNMEHLLGGDGDPAPLHGFYLGLSTVREFNCTGPCLAYTNAFRRLSLRRETTHLILLEIMARGTHGPLLGFERSNAQVNPCLGSMPEDQRVEIALFQDAVLAFVRRIEATGISLPSPAAAARVLIDGYLDFFHHPALDEVQAIGTIAHADQMFEQRHSALVHPMRSGEVLRALVDFQRRPPGWWLAGQAKLGHAPLLHAYMLAKKLKWRVQSRFTGLPD